jgi:hypothetical protein
MLMLMLMLVLVLVLVLVAVLMVVVGLTSTWGVPRHLECLQRSRPRSRPISMLLLLPGD